MEGKKLIETLFSSVIGKYPRVKPGYANFITLDFGKDITKKVKKKTGEEHVFHFGEWHLWVYICGWRIDVNGKPFVACEDTEEVTDNGISVLNSKKLINFRVLNPAFDSILEFESGYELKLFSCWTVDGEHWMFFTPNKKVFAAGPGKNWSYDYSNKP